MAKDVDEIVVGANGTVWTAPVGTAAPADQDTAPGAGWTDLGFTSEDGVTFTDSKTLEAIPVWQLFNAARRIVTERETTLGFVLRQWSKDTVPFAFGGGEITEPVPASGNFKYTPPSPEDVDERSLMVDWQDGTKKYRLVVVRGVVAEAVETNLVRTAAADLPIGFAVNGVESGDAWYLLTNDPAFEPAA
jgi:hypothetical protein